MKYNEKEKALLSQVEELQAKAGKVKAQAESIQENLNTTTISDYLDIVKKMYKITSDLSEELYDFYRNTREVEIDDDYSLEVYKVWSNLISDTHYELNQLVEYYEDHQRHLESITQWTCLPW